MIIPGFRFAGLAAGIKKNGKPDVALLVADRPVAAAGVFTRNQVVAAPVVVSRERLRSGRARAIVVNSGNANACTGAQGDRDARTMTATLAREIGAADKEVLVASTGVIGQPLPMPRVTAGIADAASALSPDGFDRFAEAICTTDKSPKVHVVRTRVGRTPVTVAGCAKGAGMIAPDMATTLAFLVTDAAASPAWLRRVLREEADRTFNRVLVDGDTSTNDSIYLLAGGQGAPVADDRAGRPLRAAVHEILDVLSRLLVADGEGAQHVVTIDVQGARTEKDARTIARRIATSPLVKTALFGADPNWGRIVAAAGAAGVPVDPRRISVDLEGVPLVRGGVGVVTPETERAAHEIMLRPAYLLRIRVGAGRARHAVTTCDLGHDYVSCNADYRS